jgi:hypothetical protein
VQEAFIRLHRHWARVHDAPAYLRSTVLNLARSRLRRRLVARRHQPTPRPNAASAEAHAVLSEDQREVIAALRGLPRRQRECLVLRYYLYLGLSVWFATAVASSVDLARTHRGSRSMGAEERRRWSAPWRHGDDAFRDRRRRSYTRPSAPRPGPSRLSLHRYVFAQVLPAERAFDISDDVRRRDVRSSESDSRPIVFGPRARSTGECLKRARSHERETKGPTQFAAAAPARLPWGRTRRVGERESR